MSTTLQKTEEVSNTLRYELWKALEEVRKEALFLRLNVSLVHDAQVRALIHKATTTKKILQQHQVDSGLTFHGFPNLPEKIRHKIWREALRLPKIIAVDHGQYKDRITGQRIVDDDAAVTPMAPHSPLLRVNREARSIAQTVLVPYHERVAGVPAVFANTDIDVMWLIDPVDYYDSIFAPSQDYAFLLGLRSLLKPQRCHGRVRQIRRLAFSWKMLIPILDALDDPTEVDRALSLFKEMAQAGVKEIYIVVDDNEAAVKQDIIFLRPQKSPQEYLKRGKDWFTNYLKLLHIEAGDGWNVVAEKLRKGFEELNHEDLGLQKIVIPSFKFFDVISASTGRVPNRRRRDI